MPESATNFGWAEDVHSSAEVLHGSKGDSLRKARH